MSLKRLYHEHETVQTRRLRDIAKEWPNDRQFQN